MTRRSTPACRHERGRQHLIQRGHAARRECRLEDALQDFTDAVLAARREGNDADLVHALKGLGRSSATWATASARCRCTRRPSSSA
jgi:hypothetical protein